MADGDWDAADSTPARLRREPAESTLWALCCCCGGEAVLNPEPWVRQGLAGHPLHALEARVRCACGARSVRLEWRHPGRPRGRGGPYAFR
jgi:hypothetical protein